MSARRIQPAVGLALALSLACASLARAQPAPEPDADVEIPAAPKPPASARPGPPPPASAGAPVSEIEALRREMRDEQARLAAQIKALEAQVAANKAAPPEPAAPVDPKASGLGSILPGAWAISAFIQAQYESHQDSQDQIQQGGVYLNQNRFLVRRGRLRLDGAWKYAELALELDANTTRGATVAPHRVEATILYRGRSWDGKVSSHGPRSDAEPPLFALTMGLTDVPFGFELVDRNRDRIFMERSLASQSFFPSEQDVGLRIRGGLGFFRYSLAALNGQPLNDQAALKVGDPNSAKDIVARLGAEARPTEGSRISGGVSALYGKGFHPGTDATKSTVQWNDLNQNSQIDPGELTGLPGMAATPSQSFTRWAVGLDLEARLRTRAGWTWLYGEVSIAQNLDRGLFVADPVMTGVDVRHLGAYAALVQDVTPYGVVGFRFDYYNPNADFLDPRAGKLIPTSQAITTFSPVFGLVLPERAKLLFQYDVVRDLLARDKTGVPVDLKNDRWTLRLQVQL